MVWEDERRQSRESRGRCVDISERGLGVVLDDPLPIRSYVQFRVVKLGFRGSGSVRFVGRKGLKYQIGLEFSGGLRWKGAKPTETKAEGTA
ncbi:MAG: hypothetical protein GY953_20290 [bacterium]|nr:hypothetical protein [bacterium]